MEGTGLATSLTKIISEARLKGNIYNRPHYLESHLSRGEAIRAYCIDCCCGEILKITDCPDQGCPLWRYRLGSEKRSMGE